MAVLFVQFSLSNGVTGAVAGRVEVATSSQPPADGMCGATFECKCTSEVTAWYVLANMHF